MNKVFVVHQPTGRRNADNQVRPIIDLSPAAAYGELVYLLDHNANPFSNLDDLVADVHRKMEDHDFKSTDHLLLVGNPILIAVAAAAATSRTGGILRCLQWNRNDRSYRAVVAHV